MAKITIEFDDTQDSSQDISVVVNRHKLLSAVNDLSDLFSQIYNGKIYDPNVEIYLKSDNCKATEEDFKKAVPFSELTKELQEKLRSIHNRQKKTVKTSIL